MDATYPAPKRRTSRQLGAIATAAVVVGVDGSPDSLAALAWSAALAGATGVVHAVHALPPSEALAVAVLQVDWTAVRESATRELADCWTLAARAAGAEVVCHVVEANVAEALLQVAHAVQSTLIVVGGHGNGLARRHRIGATAHRILHDSDLPVAVVRNGHAAIRPSAGVFVGVGHGRATQAAIDWAVGFAAPRQVPVDLVRVIEHQRLLIPDFDVEAALAKAAELFDPELLRKWNDDDLARVVERIRNGGSTDGGTADGSGVELRSHVKTGATGPVLVGESRGSAFLVMGKHYDGPLTGYFTTSTLHHVLTHSDVPIVVIAQEHTDESS